MRYVIIGLFVSMALSLPLPSSVAEESINPWRAGVEVLTMRIEGLAAAGEVDAAASVLNELLQRERIDQTGFDDRSRMALARGYLKVNRIEEALNLVKQVAWADKAPAIAADIVGLQLEIHWQGLVDGFGGIRSGMIPERDAYFSGYGPFANSLDARLQHFNDMAQLLDGGVRMVNAEGGSITLPADAHWLALANYAYGHIDGQELAERLAQFKRPQATLALALFKIHLEEHEISQAFSIFKTLQHIAGAESAQETAFELFRVWQFRRMRADSALDLFPYKQVDRALDVAARRFEQANQRARRTVDAERDLLSLVQDVAAREALIAQLPDPVQHNDRIAVEPLEIPEREPIEGGQSDIESEIEMDFEWSLAFDYPDFYLTMQEKVVPAGTRARIRFDSPTHGNHRLRVYRLERIEQFHALADQLEQHADLLTQEPVYEFVINKKAEGRTHQLSLLPEGFYAATLSTRGVPVVAVSGFTVVDPDMHVVADGEQILVWAVSRRNGQAIAEESIALEIEVKRFAAEAAGEAWQQASAAWRAGFRKGFEAEPIRALVYEDQKEDVAAGERAGKEAREKDPPVFVTLMGRTNERGLRQFSLPPNVIGRAYQATVRINRPEVLVEQQVHHGAAAHWSAKAVAWADKPMARPGETLRWRTILREFDGTRLRRPVGSVDVTILFGKTTLKSQRMLIADDGALNGEIVIPPALSQGTISLRIADGPAHHLAHVRHIELPPFTAEVLSETSGRQYPAGEHIPLRFQLRDASGEGIAGIQVTAHVVGTGLDGGSLPGSKLRAASDLSGVAYFAIPSVNKPGTYAVQLHFNYGDRSYVRNVNLRTRLFPFDLDLELADRTLHVGSVLRLRNRFPEKAQISFWLAQDGRRLGDIVTLHGQGERWEEYHLVLESLHQGANQLVVEAPVLDGEPPQRVLTIDVASRPRLQAHRQITLLAERNQVDPGETLRYAASGGTPQGTMLLLLGDTVLRHQQAESIQAEATAFEVSIKPAWGPSTEARAIAYVPGDGFITSKVQPLEIRPIDKLLRVEVISEDDDMRPGQNMEATVQVTNWLGEKVSNVSLSIGVVDHRIYGIEPDITPDLLKFFHNFKRKWVLKNGQAVDIDVPSGLLWRSVIRRWQGGSSGAFGNRYGGGKKRSLGGYGGARASELGRPLAPKVDPTIFWIGDLRTDDLGQARFRATLPEQPGMWRLTARANNVEDAVLVGELRHEVVSRLPVQGQLLLPSLTQTGDQVMVRLDLLNRRTEATEVTINAWGLERQISLPAMGRRQLDLPWTVPESGRPLTWENGQFGQREQLALTISPQIIGENPRTITQSYFIRQAGAVEAYGQRLVVAGEDGRVQLKSPTAGPAVARWVRLRAYANGAERAFEWRRSYVSSPAEQALQALFDEGSDGQNRLAELWPQVQKGGLASTLVQQIAYERGAIMAGSSSIPTNALGAWLLARGRFLGQALPRPQRGRGGANEVHLAAEAATAMLEGWHEGPQLWLAAASKALGAGNQTETSCPFGLAILADAARLLNHQHAAALAQALAVSDWRKTEVALLAVHNLWQSKLPQPSAVTVHTGLSGSTNLEAGKWTEWAGFVGNEAHVTTLPGSLLVMEEAVLIQADESAPLDISWWQPGPMGYVRVDGPVRPGVPLFLWLNPKEGSQAKQMKAELWLPTNLSLREGHDINLTTAIDWQWKVGDPQQSEWQQRQALLDLAEGRVHPLPIARGHSLLAMGTEALQQGDGSVFIQPSPSTGLAVLAPVEGRYSWGGIAVSWLDEQDLMQHRVIQPPALHVLGGPAPAMPAPPDEFPLGTVLAEMLPRLLQGEIVTLVGRGRSEAKWQEALDGLRPNPQLPIHRLLAHPLSHQQGHWSNNALRDRYAHWETLIADQDALREVLAEGKWDYTDEDTAAFTLYDILDFRQSLIAIQAEILGRIPADERHIRALPSMEFLYQTIIGEDETYADWAWNQPLTNAIVQRFMAAKHVESWAQFIRHELELDLVIDAAVPVGFAGLSVADEPDDWMNEIIGQGELGTAGLMSYGLVLQRHGLAAKLKPFRRLGHRPAVGMRLNLIWEGESAEFIIDELAMIADNRGQAVIVMRDTTRERLIYEEIGPISLRLNAATLSEAVNKVAKAIGVPVVKKKGLWEF